jgi:hypothetical protein
LSRNSVGRVRGVERLVEDWYKLYRCARAQNT